MTSLKLDENGDMVWPGSKDDLAEGLDEIRQNVKCALKVFKGESFVDRNAGISYGAIRNENLLDYLVSQMQTAILGVTGVVTAFLMSKNLDHQTRIFSVSFRVKTISGEQFTVEHNTSAT